MLSLLLTSFGSALNPYPYTASAAGAAKANKSTSEKSSDSASGFQLQGQNQVQPGLTPPAPSPVQVIPTPPLGLPYLALDLQITPEVVSVGDTFTATLTLENQSEDAANNLQVSLPLPTGVQKASGYGSGNWTWQQAGLNAYDKVVFTAPMRVMQSQQGDAVVLRVEADADGMPSPASTTSGVAIIPRNMPAFTTRFTPGTALSFRSPDGKIEAVLPADASDRPLTIRYGLTPPAGKTAARGGAGRSKGLPTFYLDATDDAGNEVHAFASPLTITATYTLEQLEALGITEGDLSLFYFDENSPISADSSSGGKGKWVPINTKVDPVARKIIVKIDHFTGFKLGDGSSPSAQYMPSLQGWQVGLQSGGLNYSYPIDVPAGAGGVKPNLSLSYSSSATDGKSGQRQLQQAGWVGKGWSFDTGYIGLNKLPLDTPTTPNDASNFSLVFDGKSYDLARAGVRPGRETLSDRSPAKWEWRSTDESFIRVRAEENTDTATAARRGGSNGGAPAKRHKWQVWTTSGIRYDFEEDAWQGFEDCVDANNSYVETYKWYLTRVEDTHGNKINYSYYRNQEGNEWKALACGNQLTYVYPDYAVIPEEITWGSTGTGERFKVKFDVVGRTGALDTDFEDVYSQIGDKLAVPHETKLLWSIKVYSNPSSPYSATGWQLMRDYRLGYADEANSLLSDASIFAYLDPNTGKKLFYADSEHKKLTLTNIQRMDNNEDAPSGLPVTTFGYARARHNVSRPNGCNITISGVTYNYNCSAEFYPRGDWNRLTSVNNGYGGEMVFFYENAGYSLAGSSHDVHTWDMFKNNRRVTSRVAKDGLGKSYTWQYYYARNGTVPQYNSLGTNQSYIGPNVWPNSAQLYHAKHATGYDRSSELVHQYHTEFRGYNYVVEKDPNNNETEHWYYRGDEAACMPGSVGDACFNRMVKFETLKGKEYRTRTHQGTTSGPVLSEMVRDNDLAIDTDDGYTVVRLSDVGSVDAFTGLWRAFTYENAVQQKTWEGTTTPVTKRTTYQYDHATGNLLSTTEYDAAGNPYRTTEHNYASSNLSDNTRYIIDRKRKDTVRQGSSTGPLLTHTVYTWDDIWGGTTPLTKGELKVVRKYFNLNVPPTQNFPPVAHSSDTLYDYDAYGNQTGVTTYAGAGFVDFTTNPPSYSAAGGDSAALATITEYDPVFRALPKKITPPSPGNGVHLIEQANYDYRMGLMTSVTDPNGQTTSAYYDTFGRMTKLVKPGDSESSPSALMQYYDNERPFKYLYQPKDHTGGRPILKFYDGMGQEIQAKSESVDGLQHVVVDKQYDGLGKVIKQSTPRYVNNAASGDGQFWGYQAVSTDPLVMLWTTTEYDAAGRTRKVTGPDGNYSETSYGLRSNLLKTLTIDAKRHKKAHYSDIFGRLVEVGDYVNETDPNAYSTTTYGYSPLDLLTSVLDANSKSTAVNYDSLGRKTSMSDPTMGTWSYEYYANGQLKKQTDAKGQWILFDYDAIERLWQKRYSDSTRVQYWYDSGVSGYYNAGRRTIMARYAANGHEVAAAWFNYDARGRQAKVDYRTGQLSAEFRTYMWTYDSAGRTSDMTYPSGEKVYYKYDAAGRQTSVCTDPSETNCYAKSREYTALDQPTKFNYGNGLWQTYEYEGVTKRLSKLRLGTDAVNNPTNRSNRTYSYDAVGNVEDINSTTTNEYQHFAYDHLDRLTDWEVKNGAGAWLYDETYTYDKLGNILSKGTTASHIAYTYNPAAGNGGPYAVDSLSNGQSFQYDANGNMTSSTASTSGEAIAARTLNWTVENLPSVVISGGVTESYTYDADDERLARTVTKPDYQTTTTYYIGGLYEEDRPSGITRSLYTLNGQVVAQSSTDPDPYGNHDTTTSNVVEGWACDPSNYTKPVAIHIYDGWGFEPNYANYIGAVMASNNRPDVASSCGGYANHAWSFTLPEYRPDGKKLKDGQAHTIVAYIIGLDTEGNGNGRVIQTWNTGHQVTLAAATPTSTPTSTPTNTPATGALVCEPVVWQNPRYVAVSGNTITKNAGVNGAWDAGASSTRGLLSGEGYAEFTIYSTSFTPKMFGFGKDDVNWHVSDVEWAAYPHSASLYAYEGTIQTGGGNQFGPFSPSLVVGEKVRVHVAADGVVRYMRDGGTGNWTTFYTTTRSVTAAEYPLRVDTSILYLNTKLTVTLCGTNLGNVTPPGGSVAAADMRATSDKDKSQAAQAAAETEQVTFADVPQDSAFSSYLEAAYRRGIVSGYSEGGVRKFRPDATATRGQLVKMMVLAFNIPANTVRKDNNQKGSAGKQQFLDVPASHPFYTYIQTAYEWGLVSGYADGTFKPDAPVTRGQLAKVAVLAARLETSTAGGGEREASTTSITDTTYLTGTVGTNQATQATFSDVPTGSTFYQYVETAYTYGILHGYASQSAGAERTFRPDERATRGQIVKITYLASQYSGQVLEETATPESNSARVSDSIAQSTRTSTAKDTGTHKLPIDTNNIPARTVIPYLPERQVPGAPGADAQNKASGSDTGAGSAGAGGGKLGGAASAASGSASAPAPYAASGPTVANALTSVVYIHSDHLGSISTVTDQGGNVVSQQQYDPWGKVRSGSVGQTKLNYTGQRKDDTGLLYFHARYYDPSLARFTSPDSIVPGAASGVGGAGGSVGAWQNSSLTVDFHESRFLTSLGGEHSLIREEGFWADDRQVSGPANPQALNRYAYVLGNPLRYTDPTGHEARLPHDGSGTSTAAACGNIFGCIAQFVGTLLARIGGRAGAVGGAGAAAAGATAAKVIQFARGAYHLGSYGSSSTAVHTANATGGRIIHGALKPGEKAVDFFNRVVKPKLDSIQASGEKIYFHLDDLQNVEGMKGAYGEHANAITAHELRYILDNWARFKDVVTFVQKGEVVPKP